MISESTRTAALEKVQTWLENLKVFSLDGSQLVWHYTRGEGLMNIVKGGTIYATQVACLNDTTEIRYASRLLQIALTDRLPSLDPASDEAAFFKRYIESLTDDDAHPNHAPSPFFVACFSELEDNLALWRSYCGGENGYAIGVRVGHLAGRPSTLVGRVNYDNDLHKSMANEIADVSIQTYQSARAERPELPTAEFNDQFLLFWDDVLSTLAPFVKDPGFRDEHEVRVVTQIQEAEKEHLVFTQRKSLLARHLPLRLPAGNLDGRQVFPISSIFIGPGRQKRVSQVSVNTLLRQCQYPEGVFAKQSVVPFQDI